MKTWTAKIVVLAMNSRLQAEVYGPFPTEEEATLWKEAQDRNTANNDWQYIVTGLLPASVSIRGSRR